MLDRNKAEVLAQRMRQAIYRGRYPMDRFLPPVRVLGDEYRTSSETVRRALKRLESEGLLRAQARHGFRVVRCNGTPYVSGPVAYVTEHNPDLSDAQPVHRALQEAFQTAAAARGSAVLGTHAGGQEARVVVDRLRVGRPWGIALDTEHFALAEAVRVAAVPTVMVNHWNEDLDFDVVQQDNYRGGFLAARHLLGAGCRALAWIGPIGKFSPTRERYAGAVAALAEAGRPPPLVAGADVPHAQLRACLDALLAGPQRPDGLLAFTLGGAKAIGSIAMERGIDLEREVRMVGWVVEECFQREYAPLFGGRKPPPAVVWSAQACATTALDRLERLGKGQTSMTLRIHLPMRIEGAKPS
jgi:LacI family transcriptional regulator